MEKQEEWVPATGPEGSRGNPTQKEVSLLCKRRPDSQGHVCPLPSHPVSRTLGTCGILPRSGRGRAWIKWGFCVRPGKCVEAPPLLKSPGWLFEGAQTADSPEQPTLAHRPSEGAAIPGSQVLPTIYWLDGFKSLNPSGL